MFYRFSAELCKLRVEVISISDSHDRIEFMQFFSCEEKQE